jgi:hypothetical protein
MKFVIYEVWTRASIVEAEDMTEALKKSQPGPREGLGLSNWHAVPLLEPMKLEKPPSPYLAKVRQEGEVQ